MSKNDFIKNINKEIKKTHKGIENAADNLWAFLSATNANLGTDPKSAPTTARKAMLKVESKPNVPSFLEGSSSNENNKTLIRDSSSSNKISEDFG